MLISVDPSSAVSLADQVSASVRRGLAEGVIRAGDRLPAAREVAAALGINLHTVLRGYQQLREEGLVELRRGRGAVVTANAGPGRAQLVEQVRALVAASRAQGLSDQETLELIRSVQASG
ncbi:GntR family transcriptional regulator [Crossiella sp. CA-258035]|uniref:GntR family transcriptional regulator n=1 Tax=Crossiella sp. CA-258035 TaxID=2981138 RepID=UPI0024BCFBD7|nr:GntR family transcriptional regulator [Crossiella sp. CA-258035]WHT16117.1 GntR family transcriptional regulator [Crossiella sp. CA-258035]